MIPFSTYFVVGYSAGSLSTSSNASGLSESEAATGGFFRDLRDRCRGVVARCRSSFLDPGRSLGGLFDLLGRGSDSAALGVEKGRKAVGEVLRHGLQETSQRRKR